MCKYAIILVQLLGIFELSSASATLNFNLEDSDDDDDNESVGMGRTCTWVSSES